MDVTQVIAALRELTGSAAAQCREDLERGARLASLPALFDASQLRIAYRRRAEHVAGQGVVSAEAVETAERLEATSHHDLALAKVGGGPSGQVFQLFLTPQRDEVVACIALRTESSG